MYGLNLDRNSIDVFRGCDEEAGCDHADILAAFSGPSDTSAAAGLSICCWANANPGRSGRKVNQNAGRQKKQNLGAARV